MTTLFALLEEVKADPVKELVVQFLASYLGIVGGVAFLVSGFKWTMRKAVEGREPLWAIGLTFALGTAAKLVMPGVYGENGLQGWALHEIILLFAAVGAQQFHDKIMNPLMGKFGGNTPPPAGGNQPPKEGGGP